LPARYGLALDMRDLDALAGLFVADVRVGRDRSGRRALRAIGWTRRCASASSPAPRIASGFGPPSSNSPTPIMRAASSTPRTNTETPTDWVIMQMMYVDDYERRDGRWFFKRRLPLYWYATDLNQPPLGAAKMRWPGVEPYEGGYHALFPSWQEFWERGGPPDADVVEPARFDEFILRMRRGVESPRIKVR
jgi:hypothetical protein